MQFVDMNAQYQRLKAEIDSGIAAVLAHGKYIMGPEVGELESRLASYCGVKHAITCANGTDALQIALMALGVGRGDAVFVPSFTFTATAEVIVLLGATPVFVDVDATTFNIDIDSLESAIAEAEVDETIEAKAIIAVDLFGLPADYSRLNAIAKRGGLSVIADAAQSFGGSHDGVKVGAMADITTTSFFPAKPLGCYGDGGALLTDNDDLAKSFKSIRLHGKGDSKYEIARIGVNSRLDTIQAAVLLPKLAVLDEEIKQRNAAAAAYTERLSNHAVCPTVPQASTSAWAQFTVKLENRDGVATGMKSADVPSAIYYPRAMHQQTAYEQYQPASRRLTNSETLPDTVLSLPMHPYLSEADVDGVCDALISAAVNGNGCGS